MPAAAVVVDIVVVVADGSAVGSVAVAAEVDAEFVVVVAVSY